MIIEALILDRIAYVARTQNRSKVMDVDAKSARRLVLVRKLHRMVLCLVFFFGSVV